MEIETKSEIEIKAQGYVDRQKPLSDIECKGAYIDGYIDCYNVYANNNWTLIDSKNIPQKEVLCINKNGIMMVGYISKDDGYLICNCEDMQLSHVTHYMSPNPPTLTPTILPKPE